MPKRARSNDVIALKSPANVQRSVGFGTDAANNIKNVELRRDTNVSLGVFHLNTLEPTHTKFESENICF